MLTFTQFASLHEATHGTLDDAKAVILTLQKHGFVGYLAGGCVRDSLAGHKPKDFDVVTDATPDEVINLFPGADLVGKQFGVVVFRGIDIATFRKDGTYTDGRRPDTVEFSRDPKDDSNRRDFTINAMFMDPFTGEILDFHGGREHVHQGLIKAVGNPDDRFTQDHLRMLRAVRFGAKLGFGIHPETKASMERHSANIASIDVERQHDELTKALAHNAHNTIVTMHQTGLLAHVLPDVDQMPPSDFATTIKTLSFLSANMGVGLSCAAVMFKLSPAAIIKNLKRLKFTNDEIKHIMTVVEMQEKITAMTPSTSLDVAKRLMRAPFFSDALKLYEARVEAKDPHAHADALHHVSQLFASMSHGDLNPEKFVTGDDLIRLGLKPGVDFKRILTAAENGQLAGRIKSKEQALDLIRAGHL